MIILPFFWTNCHIITMNAKKIIPLLIGIALISGIFIWQGITPVVGQLGEAGWSLLLVCVFVVPEYLLNGQAWRCLFPRSTRPGIMQSLWATGMGSAVNTLLPVATIGGELVKARVLTLWGIPAIDTVSTVVVDKAVQAVVTGIWALIGVAFIAVLVPGDATIISAALGALTLIAGVAAFIAIQVYGGVSFVTKIAVKASKSEKFAEFSTKASDLDAAIRLIYAHRGRFVLSVVTRLTLRIILVGELILAAHLMGHPIGIAEAIMLKTLIGALRGLAFAIPGQLGVQEGGYIAVGALLGFPASLMLAVSLANRLREMLPSAIMLFVWQGVEGNNLRKPSVVSAGSKD